MTLNRINLPAEGISVRGELVLDPFERRDPVCEDVSRRSLADFLRQHGDALANSAASSLSAASAAGSSPR